MCAPLRGLMSDSQQWQPVAKASELSPGQSRKFFLLVDGQEEECFVVNFREGLYAYVNRCQHVPISLDWVENQFFTADGLFLQCATHGAKYLPDTGECIAGPPCGKFLRRLEVRVCDDTVYVSPGETRSLDRFSYASQERG